MVLDSKAILYKHKTYILLIRDYAILCKKNKKNRLRMANSLIFIIHFFHQFIFVCSFELQTMLK